MKQKMQFFGLVFLLTFFSGYSQVYSVNTELQERKSTAESYLVKDLFLIPKSQRMTLQNDFKKVLFDVNDIQLFEYKIPDFFTKEIKGGVVKFKIPYRNDAFELEVFEDTRGLDEMIVTDGNGKEVLHGIKAKIFRGIISNDEKSLVVLTFFEDEVNGFISSPSLGNYNIEKLKDNSSIAIYPIDNLSIKQNFICGVDDMEILEEEDLIAPLITLPVLSAKKCVRLYFETRYDIFEEKKSFAEVVKYITTIYAQTETIYHNEGIQTKLSEIRVWNTPDPYTSSIGYNPSNWVSTENLLNNFEAVRTSFNGDLGQLVSLKLSGGRANVRRLCKTLNVSVAGLDRTTDIFSNNSWNTYVVTHEFGHLLGSRHTHACVWNGNKTTIDGCAAPVDNKCAWGPLPGPEGGTIMSYCHENWDIGINFSNGFGRQPGNLIRANVYSAYCLVDCVICPKNITKIIKVNVGQQEFDKAEKVIAKNIIEGTAVYEASDYLLLTPGFHAKEGSLFNAYIADCFLGKAKTLSNDFGAVSKEAELEVVHKTLILYPNPTSGTFYVSYPYDLENTYYIEVFDIKGKKVVHQKLTKENNKVMLNPSFKGVYSIRFYENEKVIIDKIILK